MAVVALPAYTAAFSTPRIYALRAVVGVVGALLSVFTILFIVKVQSELHAGCEFICIRYKFTPQGWGQIILVALCGLLNVAWAAAVHKVPKLCFQVGFTAGFTLVIFGLNFALLASRFNYLTAYNIWQWTLLGTGLVSAVAVIVASRTFKALKRGDASKVLLSSAV
jgi:hypothetical protein